ncbi:MAG: response regulator transcription factor [Cyanobacteria bacterium SBLK]|nr:response regulator transcription factor [Cyanobacteria bacterium SBLK]
MERKESTEPRYKFLVVDDHPQILQVTDSDLRQKYLNAVIVTAKTARQASERLECEQFDLVLLDLQIPEKMGEESKLQTGIDLLQNIMRQYSQLNLVILSSYIEHLVRIKSEIDKHEGGFTVAPKGLSNVAILTRVDAALNGCSHTRDIWGKGGVLELRPEWNDVLTLAFQEGLADKTIANRMNVAERTVRHYWTKLYDVLDIDTEEIRNEGKSLRVCTGIRARKKGLIE